MRTAIRILPLFLFVSIAGTARAQHVPIAIDDFFDVSAEDSIVVPAPGLLANDSSDYDLSAALISPPSYGVLELGADGSLWYRPNSGFTGTDSFTYVAQSDGPERFVVDNTQSGVRFSAELKTTFGDRSSSDSSGVAGTITAEVIPNEEPFEEIHLSSAEMVLSDALSLKFDFGFIGGEINVDTDPDSLRMNFVEVGSPAPTIGGGFTQIGNMLAVGGTLHVDASGLAGTVIQDGPQDFEAAVAVDLIGTIVQRDTILHLDFPVDGVGAFEVDGNTVDVSIVGSVAATALLSPQSSNIATVTLLVGTVGTAIDDEPGLPTRFALEQNFPNPVSDWTTVRYTLAEAFTVSLIVYDALGRRVRTLANGFKAAGSHEAALDATELPVGLYLYQLNAGVFSQTRRLVVVR